MVQLVICNKCGTEDVDHFTYCSLCGAKLEEYSVNKDKELKVNKNVPLLLALTIGVIIVLVANL